LLLILGAGVLAGVVWRLVAGSHPEGGWMMGIAFIALIVNATVLRLLERFRHGEVHLRATWLFTRVDVIANLAVIISGVLVLVLHSALPDLVIGAAIACYVLKEALGILREAKEARVAASESTVKP
jgi:Co/Zn/Cd efflux system component